ncbi:hypothetical protein PP460_gp072 [Streptomyces phage Muntaha]|uniref:Uncharacterized protein n=1 Tax=Streptomyces phage Muntaha TaxID=2713269 RepID=A0A6G8R3F0_9CAUD|nr:hypothetical protein PP460_gp072 [Streptomyces phage Muntaha]QIN94730.1 hypothetical protein SEA_MUNTAHA_206 [Streptomyces phage Muntaha]
MPQLRSSNRRAIVDNGQGHELTVLPKTRKSTENFCPVANRLTYKVNDNRRAVVQAGRAVVKCGSERNINSLNRCKSFLEDSRAELMNHLLTCETCTK